MAAQRQSASVLLAPQQQLLVSGLVYTPGLTVTFGTFYPLTSTVPPDASSGTAYCLELRSATEAVLDSRCFELTFTSPETGDPVNAGAFTLVLPYPEGTKFVVLTHQGAELGRVVASNNAPSVRLISPNGGESWGASGTYTVTWTASDPDNDPLRFIVSYSPDNGTTWMPLALDGSTSSLVVDSHNLPGSTNALLKVEVTDQMHMAEDVSDAPFTVERKAPQAFILSPEEPITITVGTPLWLQGYAYDLEDGALADAALGWSSSRDGNLGTGSTVLASLSLGHHTVTLTATDSNGNQATASAQVLVTFAEDLVPDCRVDAADLQAIADHWRQTADSRFDLDGDGDVDVADVMRVARMWGRVCP